MRFTNSRRAKVWFWLSWFWLTSAVINLTLGKWFVGVAHLIVFGLWFSTAMMFWSDKDGVPYREPDDIDDEARRPKHKRNG